MTYTQTLHKRKYLNRHQSLPHGAWEYAIYPLLQRIEKARSSGDEWFRFPEHMAQKRNTEDYILGAAVEYFIGIKPNNSKNADIFIPGIAMIECKAQRRGTSSDTTCATLKPSNGLPWFNGEIITLCRNCNGAKSSPSKHYCGDDCKKIAAKIRNQAKIAAKNGSAVQGNLIPTQTNGYLSNTELFHKMSYVSTTQNGKTKKRLHTTIKAPVKNYLRSEYEISLTLDTDQILLTARDQIDTEVVYYQTWAKHYFLERLDRKLGGVLVYFTCESQMRNVTKKGISENIEFFRIVGVDVHWGYDYEKPYDLLKSGTMTFDLRMSEKNNNKDSNRLYSPKDHGSGFRLDDIGMCYSHHASLDIDLAITEKWWL